ncbi:MAG TPA: ammonium transporter [Candidatus Baltobacteraceae bacterium]|nr:ammonium transporter [Candidatus Baltobacteraceae bacterium]
MNSGDTAWQLTSATLVGMMSIPGLAILYAGLVKKKWALNSAVMCFYAFSIVLVAWSLWGYNMSFGSAWLHFGANQFLGFPSPAIGAATEIGQAVIPAAASSLPPLRFSGSAMIYFQFVFAAITPLLIAGSVLGRMNFKAWMIFVPLWSTIVYSAGAFSLWGGGWAAQLGVADYSGGYVIHLAAGISGFVTAAMVGPRLLADRKDFEPNNLIVALAGAGLLWLGWNGFNGGDPFTANHDAAAAVLNTNIATALSLLCWLILDMFATGKPNAVSMINGMIVGLVAITPAAGYVDGYGAMAIGVVAGVIAWLSYNKLGKTALVQKVDDTFGVLHTHGVAGLVGGLIVGIVANPKMIEFFSTKTTGKDAVADVSVGGLLYTGDPAQLWKQAVGALFIILWNLVATAILLKLISFVVPLRASDGDVEGGDLAIHGIDPVPYHPAGAV